LTVTFDDENSLDMQVMSGVIVDDDTDITDLTDEDFANRATKRIELRLKNPGLGSKFFSMWSRLDGTCGEIVRVMLR
jgi:hypothetical protein